jgi:hypothetical protein
MSKTNTPTPAKPSQQRDEKTPRFTDLREPRRVPLDHRRTDEEARLAAEIEKLRG